MENEYSFDNDDVCRGNSQGFVAACMRLEIVDGDFDDPTCFEVCKALQECCIVKRIWVIEVIICKCGDK